MGENLNTSRNKRLMMRSGDLNLKYKDSIITSEDWTESGSTFNQTFLANKLIGTMINNTIKIVDYKIDMDGRIIVIGDNGEEIILNIGTGFNNEVYPIIQDTNGKYLVGGSFTSYSGVTANRIIRLNNDGSIDNTFNSGTGFNSSCSVIIQDTNGKYVVGGEFTTYSGVTGNRIIRLNQNGSIDNTFNIGSGFSIYGVNAITKDTNGKYLVGGSFTSYSGVTANRIIRLNNDGSIDNTFNSGTGFNSSCSVIIQDTNGKYVVGGEFTTYSGVTANGIIRLNQDGSIDNTFNIGSGFDYGVYSIIQNSNGKYVVGGSFTSYSGVTANYIIRLNQDGSIDNTFILNTNFDNSINSIFETLNGEYVVVGYFTTYSGVTANNIIRLNQDGSIDNTFNTGTGFNNNTYVIIQDNNGKYLIGGRFTSYSGITTNRIISLNQDGSSNTVSTI